MKSNTNTDRGYPVRSLAAVRYSGLSLTLRLKKQVCAIGLLTVIGPESASPILGYRSVWNVVADFVDPRRQPLISG